MGSARAVNWRYISDCVPNKLRMKASAGFVSASALGMVFGPALACLFQTKFKIFKITLNQETLPGWFLAFAWLVYLLWLWIAFKEPPNEDIDNAEQQEANMGLETCRLENGFTQPLLLSSGENQEDEDEDQECDPSEEAEEDIHKPVTSIVSAYRLLTPSVKV